VSVAGPPATEGEEVIYPEYENSILSPSGSDAEGERIIVSPSSAYISAMGSSTGGSFPPESECAASEHPESTVVRIQKKISIHEYTFTLLSPLKPDYYKAISMPIIPNREKPASGSTGNICVGISE
jgi:hypothetical protein